MTNVSKLSSNLGFKIDVFITTYLLTYFSNKLFTVIKTSNPDTNFLTFIILEKNNLDTKWLNATNSKKLFPLLAKYQSIQKINT